MRKSNPTPKLGHGTKDQGVLEDDDLEVATGGAPQKTVKFGDIRGESTDKDHRDWVLL